MEISSSQTRGCLLGALAGDRVGARAEGLQPSAVRSRYDGVKGLISTRPGNYGAATEMIVATAESLAAAPQFDGEDMAGRIVSGADASRGYGHGTWAAIERLRAGEWWREAAAGVGGRASFGNGAAVRCAPVGLLYGHDVEQLRWVAEEAAAITHQHALGAEGAVLQAVAVAVAALSHGQTLSGSGFLLAVGGESGLREYTSRYEGAAHMVEKDLDPRRVVDKLGNGFSALGSVVTAAACFAREPESFEGAVALAASLGGNATSIASMTGAIAGAYLGADAVPERWVAIADDSAAIHVRLLGAADVLARAAGRLE